MESYIPNILENFLGDHRKHSEHKSQISFDCPECDNDEHKGNLEVNYLKGVFKCWACKDINNMHGSIFKLIKKYGSKSDLQTYILLQPNEYSKDKVIDNRVLIIPEGLTLISEANNDYRVNNIKKYLEKRKISDKIINKYRLYFTTSGPFRNRVIVPSFNHEGNIEYYVTRAIYDNIKPKYVNADLDKDLIVFFEEHINWDSTIYIVEGVFDAMVIPNSIPILGKYISDKLFNLLQEKSKGGIVIILDGDAINDAELLYTKLNTLELFGKIKIVKLSEEWDLSKINEKLGVRGIFKVLKSAHTLMESRIFTL